MQGGETLKYITSKLKFEYEKYFMKKKVKMGSVLI